MATKKEENAKKTCFVIMPFSDSEGYEPGHFRNIYDYTFCPAIRAAGFEPRRVDDDSVSNLIHSRMLNDLITAPMVLCDLSTNNPNVLWELGIRHAFNRPVVLVQEAGQKHIFDLGIITAIEYHPSRLYEDVVTDQENIKEAILQTAEAKNKYSIMDLAAMDAAKPSSSDAVSREDRLEYLILDMSRKLNSVERRLDDVQKRGTSSRRSRQLDSDSLMQFRDYMDETEEYLARCEKGLISPTVEDVEIRSQMLYKKFIQCEDEVHDFERARASGLDEELLSLESRLLSEKKKKRTDPVSIIDNPAVD